MSEKHYTPVHTHTTRHRVVHTPEPTTNHLSGYRPLWEEVVCTYAAGLSAREVIIDLEQTLHDLT